MDIFVSRLQRLVFKNLKGLLDFLHSVLSELEGSGDVLLGPVEVFICIPVPHHYNVLPLLFILQHKEKIIWLIQKILSLTAL